MNTRSSFIALVAASVVGLMLTFGCGDEQIGQDTTIEQHCPGEECDDCGEHADCGDEAFCHPGEGVCVQFDCEQQEDCDYEDTRCDEEAGRCVADVCEPGEVRCDDAGEGVMHCEDDGAGWAEPIACGTGACHDGACGCGSEDDCAPGEECDEGVCECASGISCGEDNVCCGEDESCIDIEICDEDGDCETTEQCRFECQGEVCGFDGELCCEGARPVCGPGGECAPDCEGEGELCGEQFDECCPAGEICIFGECVEPGEDCEHFTDCDFGEYCDEAVGKCLPDDFPEDLVCEEDYDFAGIEPEIRWQWDGVEADGQTWSNVMMTPVAADMDGSGTPNVIFNAYREGGGSPAIPVVADGADGETVYYNASRQVNFATQLAVADITDNGLPEIVVVADNDEGIGVIRDIETCDEPDEDEDGCYLWWNDEDVETDQGAPVVADLNADGDVEIVLRETILDGETGDEIAQLDAGGYDYTVTADVTGDGKLEILGMGCLYSLDEDHELTELWCTDEPVADDDRKRYAAVGDVTDDGTPEFVLTGDGNVYVIDADDGTVLHEFPVHGGGAGGSPIIADFDGDGSAEFGVASANCYTVFDLDCLDPDAEGPDDLMEDQPGCERPEIDTCDYGHHCACHELRDTKGTGDGVLWSIYVQDESSHRTGSSVFDFQGDGRNEVVYNDECLLMVLDGQTGEPYFIHGNTNRTSSEYPIVADVTGDNQTNIVVSANNDEFSRDCETPINTQPERFPWCHPDDGDEEVDDFCQEGTHGVIALQDPEDRWVRTRPIWNQFDYYIDNAEDDAGVPTSPEMPWEGHNTFRANRQGEVPLNAADVTVSSVQVDALTCPMDLNFQATIQNEGMAAIPAGMPVSLYLYEPGVAEGELVETKQLDEPISPGGLAQVAFDYEVNSAQINIELDFEVVANDDGSGEPPVADCNPEKASYLAEDVICHYEG